MVSSLPLTRVIAWLAKIQFLACVCKFSKMENTVDPDQLGSYNKPADLDLHHSQSTFI